MEMDKDQKLNDLFAQARTETPKVGFEEMKRSFSTKIEIPSIVDSATPTSHLFTIKTWTIMIATIMTTGVTLAYLTGFFSAPLPLERIKPPVKSISALELSTYDLMLLEMEESDLINEITSPTVYQPEISQEELIEQVREPELIDPEELVSVPSVFQEKKETVENYRFPMLTKEEKKMYAKKKAAMIKKWIKRDKTLGFIPMGKWVYGEDSLTINPFYMSQLEVSNFQYRTFLFDLLEQGRRPDFLIAKPDQSLWNNGTDFNEPLVALYFSHPAYNEYPVNNISRQGAVMYCEWLTTEVNTILKSKNKPRISSIRLPYDVEWDYAASGGQQNNVFPWGGPNARNSTGCYLANFNPEGENPNEDGAMQTAAVDSYMPNGFGLYCMSGNIAEMVYDYKDKSVLGTKGGSFLSPIDSIQINVPMQHVGISKPNLNIGFRVVSSFMAGNAQGFESSNSREKIGFHDVSGKFHFPYLYEKDRKFYAKSKKQMMSKAGDYKNDAYLMFMKDTFFLNQDSLHVRDVFIKSTEVTNLEYRTFLIDLFLQGKKEIFQEAFPGQNVWSADSKFARRNMDRYYLSHPAYNHYPVVGVTQRGVELYCKWFTEEGLNYLYSQSNEFYLVEMRLPTFKEWESAASDQGKYKRYPWKGKSIVDVDSNYLANCYLIKDNHVADAAIHTNSIKKFPPSPNKLYGMAGNVSEITISESGEVILKGGSWASKSEEIQIYTSQNFGQLPLPNSRTGFRSVIVFEYKFAQKK